MCVARARRGPNFCDFQLLLFSSLDTIRHHHGMASLLSSLGGPSALAMAGGFMIGTYPIFVKTPAVLKAKVHPAAFQAYKSFWVALTGAAMVTMRWARGQEPVYAFTWWAVIAACAWLPAGMCLISATPRAGVGGAVLIFDGSTTLLSFVVGLAAFHEELKEHITDDGKPFYLAQYYLALLLVGMAGLVVLPRWVAASCGRARALHPADGLAETLLAPPAASSSSSSSSSGGGGGGSSSATPWWGYLLAVGAGTFSAVQYGLVTTGKKLAGASPSAYDKQALDPLGSWTATFGLAALLLNLLLVLGLRGAAAALGTPPPDLKLPLVWREASAAGLCYTMSVLLTTTAVNLGGNAVVLAQRNAVSLVTSGAWGLLWYREWSGLAALAWCAAAAVTMASVILLGFEKGGA